MAANCFTFFLTKNTTQIKKILKELNPDVLLTLYGLNSDSGSYSKPATFDGIGEFKVNKDLLHREISELRVFKTQYELGKFIDYLDQF